MDTVRRNPLRRAEAKRRRNRLSGCQHVQRASEALHGVGAAKAKAETSPDLDSPFCREENVGRVGRWKFGSVGNKCRTRGFHNGDGLEPGDSDAPLEYCFKRHRFRGIDLAK